jgi:hypothetical protein
VIWLATHDGAGAIDLLDQHQPRYLVRQRPRSERELESRSGRDLGCETERSADQKGEIAIVLARALQ